MQCPIPHNNAPRAASPAAAAPPAKNTLEALLWESGDADGIRPRSVDEWPLPEELDMARPVSELLRKGTERAHATAEHSDGAVALTNGQLELQEYVRWLAIIWRVYDTFEKALVRYANHSVLAPTYNPTLLERAPAIANDITFLLKRLPKHVSKPSSNPLALAPAGVTAPPFPLPPFLAEVFVHTPPALQVYMDRLNECAESETMAPRLLAHAYVRYLGDLSGGQIIGARMRKAYGLPGLDGRRFYYFDMGGDSSAAEAGEETVGERKKKLNDVKTWYRTGMDEGVGADPKLKATLIQEANVAFLLNTHLFTLITPPPAEKPRYYEKVAMEKARRERLAPPPATLSERLIQTGYLLAITFVILFLMQKVAPHLEPVARPVWDRAVAPTIENYVVPFWHSLQPFFDKLMRAQARNLF